jgi:hypothetical protein
MFYFLKNKTCEMILNTPFLCSTAKCFLYKE